MVLTSPERLTVPSCVSRCQSFDGWGHNTKEYAGNAVLAYMSQRWYQPELGVFMSQAPYPPSMEHPYSFSYQRPVSILDVLGSTPWMPDEWFPGSDGPFN